MKHLVCPNCGNTETAENLFPGIFAKELHLEQPIMKWQGYMDALSVKQFSTAPIQIIFNIEN